MIVWNDPPSQATPFLAEYEKLLFEFSTDYEQVSHRRTDDPATIRAFFRTEPQLKIFSSAQQFDFDGLKGRLLSSSFAPEVGHPKHAAMVESLKRIFDTHQQNGCVMFEYDTHVYFGKPT